MARPADHDKPKDLVDSAIRGVTVATDALALDPTNLALKADLAVRAASLTKVNEKFNLLSFR